MVTPELIEKLKLDQRITFDIDANLQEKLMRSMRRINTLMGVEIDYEADAQARELLFNRFRYDYNNNLEAWPHNFATEILSLQLHYAAKEVRADDPGQAGTD